MIDTDLRALLRRWGRVFGIRSLDATEDDEECARHAGGVGQHVLVSGSPSTRYERPNPRRRTKTRTYLDADGNARREPAPKIVCYGSQSKGGTKPMHMDPRAEAVEVAVIDLYRQDRIKAVVLRMEYCAGRIGRSEKTRLAGNSLDMRLTGRRYRHELEVAHAWLLGRFSGAHKRVA